jgi:F-type H+-transporting ATPase subunit b
MLDFTITFVFSLLNIAVLFIILRKVLFKPVTKFIETRSNSIHDQIDSAAKSRAEAETLREQYENKLKTADEEAMQLAKSAQISAQKHCQALIAEAKIQADNILFQARKQIDAEKQTAYLEFKAEAAALVIAATGKILRREIKNDEDDAGNILLELGKKL